MTVEGILPVSKPAEWTSHDVVAKVRRLLRIKRIGHTGTLDPMVTGVLPLCVGKATRLVEYLQELPKEYEVVMRLGMATDTQDMSGKVLRTSSEPLRLTEDEIRQAVQSFLGEIEQVPPMHSAVKVQGKRLYELAREGREVPRKPRRVTIHRLDITHMDWNDRFPAVHFRVLCSKGTYIRTLCEDIGKQVGVPSVMEKLVRTRSGGITLDQCHTLEEIEQAVEAGELSGLLIPSDVGVSHFPAAIVGEKQARQAVHGQNVRKRDAEFEEKTDSGLLRLYARDGEFLGIFRLNPEAGRIEPVKVFGRKKTE